MISFVVTTNGEFHQTPTYIFEKADVIAICGDGEIEVMALDKDYAIIYNKSAEIFNKAVFNYIQFNDYSGEVDPIRGNVIFAPIEDIRF